MRTVSWIIQKNLVKEDVLAQLRVALKDIPYQEVFVVPFSSELPPLAATDSLPIFYGTTTLMLNAYQHPHYRAGVFYDPLAFEMKNYLARFPAECRRRGLPHSGIYSPASAGSLLLVYPAQCRHQAIQWYRYELCPNSGMDYPAGSGR